MSFLVGFFLFIPRVFRILVPGDCEFLSLLCCIKVFIEKKNHELLEVIDLRSSQMDENQTD